MKPISSLWAGLFGLVFCLVAAGAEQPDANAEKFALRYKFQPGETLRWNVTHRMIVRTSISKLTETAETNTSSIKAWRVTEVKPDGTATFEHLIEHVDMRQQRNGHNEVHYDSRTDKAPPAAFSNIVDAVGVPLVAVTLDAHGKVLKRQRKPVRSAASGEGQITIPLPEEPVTVGASWSVPHEINVPGKYGLGVNIKTRQRFT
jgi:hypothetical protein